MLVSSRLAVGDFNAREDVATVWLCSPQYTCCCGCNMWMPTFLQDQQCNDNCNKYESVASVFLS